VICWNKSCGPCCKQLALSAHLLAKLQQQTRSSHDERQRLQVLLALILRMPRSAGQQHATLAAAAYSHIVRYEVAASRPESLAAALRQCVSNYKHCRSCPCYGLQRKKGCEPTCCRATCTACMTACAATASPAWTCRSATASATSRYAGSSGSSPVRVHTWSLSHVSGQCDATGKSGCLPAARSGCHRNEAVCWHSSNGRQT